jgi:nuclear transport factor 2 (NTF2) superfamily protein
MERELDYRLIKELWTFAGNRIAGRFVYEFHDDAGSWFHACGNKNCSSRTGSCAGGSF